MTWNFVIIGAIVLIFIVLLRRVPTAIRFQQKEKEEVAPEVITAYGLAAQADDAFESKDFDKAEDLYIKIAAQEPNNPKVYNRLGAIYLEQENFYDAKDAFLLAQKLEPNIASRYINLGMAYMGLKDYFKATEAFKNAVKLEPQNSKYEKYLERASKLKEKESKK
jgi:Flp pilus assembly protein TadD